MPSLIGNKPNQVPTNGDLGTLAFEDADNVLVGNLNATGVTTVQAGTVSAPAITTTGDTNTGIFFPAADTIAFTEGGEERMRITSAGNVGIGTSSPNFKLENTTAADIGNNAIYSTTAYAFGRSATPCYITAFRESFSTNSSIVFHSNNNEGTAPSEKMRLTASGNLVVGLTSARANAGDVQVSKGISFPATQSAQSDANTLDDYEEGSFTPTIVGGTTAGTGTYAIQVGRYTKVGNTVTVQLYVNWTAHTGTGQMLISGLPFTAQNTANLYNAITVGECNNIALTANNIMTCDINANFTSISCIQYPVGGGAVSTVPIDTSGYLIVGGTYFV
jgi:hypothetical protein